MSQNGRWPLYGMGGTGCFFGGPNPVTLAEANWRLRDTIRRPFWEPTGPLFERNGDIYPTFRAISVHLRFLKDVLSEMYVLAVIASAARKAK